MYSEKHGHISPTWRAWATCYSLFAVILVAMYFIVFIIWRETLLAGLGAVSDLQHWSITRVLYMFGVLFIGFGGFIMVMISEPYLRGGVECRQLKRRFLRLSVLLGGVTVLGLVLQVVL